MGMMVSLRLSVVFVLLVKYDLFYIGVKVQI